MPDLVHLLAAAAPADPDADLLARFVAGRDADAFAELVRRHGPAVLGTCRRLVGRSAADDAFQATFLVLAARAGSVRKAASVGSWLVGVAGRVGRRMRVTGQRTENRGQTIDPDQLPAPGSPPDLCLLSSDLSALLADEFTRLPDKLRAAAVACLLDGRTQDQAAAALGWSSRTVRRRLDEAKALLRTRLERRGIIPAMALAALAATAEAVPAALARKTTDGATLFLAGGGADAPAAALAHGVLGAMTTIRSTVAAAVCVAALAGLGVGWASDAAPPGEPDRIPAPAAKAEPAPAAAGPHVHKTANFEVTAPTAAVARAVGEEFERQRKAAAIAWSGFDLPVWKEPVTIRLRADAPGRYPYTGEARAPAIPGADDFFGSISPSSLEDVLNWHAHYHAETLVVHTLLDRSPPWWCRAALAQMANPDSPPAFWTTSLAPARKQLEAGDARRLSALFSTTQAAGGTEAQTQGTTVIGFLLSRAAEPHAPGARLIPYIFIRRGCSHGWEEAARVACGYPTLADLERAWIDWVRGEPGPPPDPDRIPPPAAAPAPAAARREGVTRTDNFAVTAPSIEVAERVTVAAEKHRREVARRWLGAELPPAAQPVSVRVSITAGNQTGATTFTFGESDGKRPPGVKTAAMELRGPLDTLLKATLPHEVTHVVLATHFGRPLPRWADEGIAVLSESDGEQFSHAVRARELLNAGRAIRLSTLFRMTDYPRDHVVLFAQGYSVCRFLLERADKEPALVAFLATGMSANTAESWARAAKEVYGFDSLDALEQAWIDSLRAPPARR